MQVPDWKEIWVPGWKKIWRKYSSTSKKLKKQKQIQKKWNNLEYITLPQVPYGFRNGSPTTSTTITITKNTTTTMTPTCWPIRTSHTDGIAKMTESNQKKWSGSVASNKCNQRPQQRRQHKRQRQQRALPHLSSQKPMVQPTYQQPHHRP